MEPCDWGSARLPLVTQSGERAALEAKGLSSANTFCVTRASKILLFPSSQPDTGYWGDRQWVEAP